MWQHRRHQLKSIENNGVGSGIGKMKSMKISGSISIENNNGVISSENSSWAYQRNENQYVAASNNGGMAAASAAERKWRQWRQAA
jgi:hypothetical protein